MARTNEQTPQTREEKLRKKREAERKRYQRLKQDPVGREKLRQKEITQYLKKKEKNVIKPMKDLSVRDQRRKRKQWREYSQTYRNKKKRTQTENDLLIQRMHENTPPESGAEEDLAIVPVTPENNRRLSASKKYVRNRKKRSRENKRKNELIKTLKLRIQKYKQKYYRLKKINIKTDPPTPSKRVVEIMKEDRNVVVKKLLFAEVITDQLKTNYKNLTSIKEKQIFKNVLGGELIKKYRIKHILNPIVRGSKIAGKNTEGCITRCHRNRNTNIINKKKNLIRTFLEEDCNSKLCPGKKDYISKNKVTKQKRYLCDTMGNLHKKFLECNPDMLLSYAFFCKNRPFWIVSRKVTARDTCGCTYCMNMALIIQTLHRLDVIEVSNPTEVTRVFCCEHKTATCLLRECLACIENKICYKPYDGTRIGHYFKWSPKKYTFFDKKISKRKMYNENY